MSCDECYRDWRRVKKDTTVFWRHKQPPKPQFKKTQNKILSPKKKTKKDVDTLALENNLTSLLGLKVSIDLKGEGGALTVRYNTLEQLDEVLLRLGNSRIEKINTEFD